LIPEGCEIRDWTCTCRRWLRVRRKSIGYCHTSCETAGRVRNLTLVKVEVVCTFPVLPLELEPFLGWLNKWALFKAKIFAENVLWNVPKFHWARRSLKPFFCLSPANTKSYPLLLVALCKLGKILETWDVTAIVWRSTASRIEVWPRFLVFCRGMPRCLVDSRTGSMNRRNTLTEIPT
jgi:hypothetical protein